MKPARNVKIIATVGPASSSAEMIEKLFMAGVDVFRINMSHSDHPGLLERHNIIRKLETEHDRPIGILVDLQGPKLRIGTFKKEHVTIKALDTFVLDDNPDPGDKKRVHLPHP
ncbi:MAG: pyruvate kinase, partial [Aestuariivirgaceae bacterium]